MHYNLTLKRGLVTSSAQTENVKNAGLRSDGELVQAVSEESSDTIIFASREDESLATAEELASVMPDDPGCSVDDTAIFGDDKPIKDTGFGDEMPDDLPAG